MGNSLSASLLLAARTGNANGVKQLVEQGASIDTTFEDEKTALHVAAEEGINFTMITTKYIDNTLQSLYISRL